MYRRDSALLVCFWQAPPHDPPLDKVSDKLSKIPDDNLYQLLEARFFPACDSNNAQRGETCQVMDWESADRWDDAAWIFHYVSCFMTIENKLIRCCCFSVRLF